MISVKTAKSILVAIFLGLQSSCGGVMEDSCSVKKDRAVVQIAKEILYKYKDFRHTGVGGSIKGENSEFFMGFEVDRELEKDEIRSILVEIATVSIKSLNQNIDIKQCLGVSAFGVKNLTISITPVLNNDIVRDPGIGNATLMNGTVSFRVLKKNDYGLVSNEKETFEETLQIVRDQK